MTSDYLAIQVDPSDAATIDVFVSLTGLPEDDAPGAWELLTTTDSSGMLNVVHLGYWTDPLRHARWAQKSGLARWFCGLRPDEIGFGAWHEVVQAPPAHVETIFSDPRKPFGYAQCPPIELEPMTMNGYYGAARDRLAVSAIDTLEAPGTHLRREPAPSRGARLRAVVGHNTAVIRSGQYWEPAEGEQLRDYEGELEPRLLRGMDHLASRADVTGTMSLRILHNVDRESLRPRRETSVLAYFHELGSVEKWAEQHATHAAIYEHAIAKNRQYGTERTVTTWHEVFVLPETATFEYVNCHPSTGLLVYAKSVWQVIDD